MRRGFVVPLKDINHMIPFRDRPDLRLDWNNLDGVCGRHHYGLMAKMENHARKVGSVDMLPTWIKFPETRPARFQISKFGPMAGKV